jgi:hypothetical protein
MNEQLKPYKTLEEIAKKHRLEASFIQKQLDMGAPIEHEHTKNQKLATEIALQHLDEIPDYYTRLKKLEADAKKHHKKFKDVNFSGAVKELENELKKLNDISYDSIDKLMRRIMKKHNMTAKELHNAFVERHNKTPDAWIKKLNEGNLHHWFKGSKSKDGKPGWVEVISGEPCAREEGETGTPKCVSSSKRASMSKAERISAQRRKSAADPNQPEKSGASKPTYVSTDKPEKKMNEEKDIKGKSSGKKDACYTKVKSRYDVWPSAYASGALVKCRKVGAANWGNKSESINLSSKDPLSEQMSMMRYCPKCEKDETREECKYGPKYWDMFSIPSSLSTNQMKFSIAQVHPANESKEPDHEYSMARSELSTIISAAKRLRGKLKGEGNIEAWVQSKITKAADYIDAAADYLDSGEHNVQGSMDEACWSGYKKVGMKKKGKKMVPNCVPESVSIEDASGNPYVEFIDIIKPEVLKRSKGIGSRLLGEKKLYSNWREELAEDWQSVNRKDKTDGLSQKAVNAYRRENPGSKLQTAVTEKKPKGKRAKRRKNFCSRMSGMKSKLTSAKTARDPDSRINKALRRWNCN